jgi:hypothetical protein
MIIHADDSTGWRVKDHNSGLRQKMARPSAVPQGQKWDTVKRHHNKRAPMPSIIKTTTMKKPLIEHHHSFVNTMQGDTNLMSIDLLEMERDEKNK